MPVTPRSLAAFERLVRFFAGMAMLGVGFIIAGIIVGVVAHGATRAATLAALCGSGGLMVIVGLREWRKGGRMVSDMRRRIPRSSQRRTSLNQC